MEAAAHTVQALPLRRTAGEAAISATDKPSPSGVASGPTTKRRSPCSRSADRSVG